MPDSPSIGRGTTGGRKPEEWFPRPRLQLRRSRVGPTPRHPKGSSRRRSRRRNGPEGAGSETRPLRKDEPEKAETRGRRPEPNRKGKQGPRAGGRSPIGPTRPRPCRGKALLFSERKVGTRRAGVEQGGSLERPRYRPKEMDFIGLPRAERSRWVDEPVRRLVDSPRPSSDTLDARVEGGRSEDGFRREQGLLGATGIEEDRRRVASPKPRRSRRSRAVSVGIPGRCPVKDRASRRSGDTMEGFRSPSRPEGRRNGLSRVREVVRRVGEDDRELRSRLRDERMVRRLRVSGQRLPMHHRGSSGRGEGYQGRCQQREGRSSSRRQAGAPRVARDVRQSHPTEPARPARSTRR